MTQHLAKRGSMSRRRAFTLVELLVVIGIIILLLSILMPAISKARDSANGVKCASHVRTLTGAFLLFARDHDGHLPGTWKNYRVFNDFSKDHGDWLFGLFGSVNAYATLPNGQPGTLEYRAQLAPQSGTIFDYVKSPEVYLCPSLSIEKMGTHVGSNGRYDYAAFACFNGASLRSVRPLTTLHYFAVNGHRSPANDPNFPTSASARDPLWTATFDTYWGNYTDAGFSTFSEDLPTPIVCQEEPEFSINSSGDAFTHHDDDWTNMDGFHVGWERMAHCHSGGSYYGAIDGSVVWVNEPDIDASDLNPTDPDYGAKQTAYWKGGAHLWWQKGPSSSIPRPLTCGVYDGDGYWNWWATR